MSQSVLDEIARISLEISKQIAVATGVSGSKLNKGISEHKILIDLPNLKS